MPNARLSNEKQVFILAALSEGMAINATCRMFGVGKNAVLRVIDETGEAMAVYMRTNFRDLPCEQVAFDEAWQYVGKHGQRMATKEDDRGDFWLWGAICNVSRLVISWHIGSRKGGDCQRFVYDVAGRIKGKVQITTDALASYPPTIRMAFGERASHATEIKEFFEDESSPAYSKKKNGVPKIAKAKRGQGHGQSRPRHRHDGLCRAPMAQRAAGASPIPTPHARLQQVAGDAQAGGGDAPCDLQPLPPPHVPGRADDASDGGRRGVRALDVGGRGARDCALSQGERGCGL